MRLLPEQTGFITRRQGKKVIVFSEDASGTGNRLRRPQFILRPTIVRFCDVIFDITSALCRREFAKYVTVRFWGNRSLMVTLAVDRSACLPGRDRREALIKMRSTRLPITPVRLSTDAGGALAHHFACAAAFASGCAEIARHALEQRHDVHVESGGSEVSQSQ